MWANTKENRSPIKIVFSKTAFGSKHGKHIKKHSKIEIEKYFVREREILDAYYCEDLPNYILRALSLHCVRRTHAENMKLIGVWSWVKILVVMFPLTTISMICLYYKIQLYMVNKHISRSVLTAHILYVFGLLQYVLDLIYSYKYGREDCIKHFNNYDNIDIILGLTKYREIRRKISFVFICVSLMSISCYALEYALWAMQGVGYLINLYAMEYLFLFIKVVTIMGMVGQCIQIEYRLRCIGNSLLLATSRSDPARGSNQAFVHPKCMDTMIYNSKNHLDVKWLNKCYLLIQNQCHYINKFYGLKVLLSSMYYLVYLIITCNTMMRVLTGQIMPKSKLPALGHVLSFMAVYLVLFILTQRCERCYRACEWVITIIDGILINRHNDFEDQEALELLRDLISSNPITFHAVNFFRIDYSLLVSIASVVITYTIIMFQSVS